MKPLDASFVQDQKTKNSIDYNLLKKCITLKFKYDYNICRLSKWTTLMSHPSLPRLKSAHLQFESCTQCARTDLNKRFLPKPMTTTG